MKHTLLVLLLVFFSGATTAQTLTAMNAMHFGGSTVDGLWNMTLDPNGNTIISGSFTGTADLDPGPAQHAFTSSGEFDGFVVKLDSEGEFVWAITYGGPENDGANDVAVDASGNVYVTGYITGTVDMEPGTGSTMVSSGAFDDMVLAKYAPNGTLIWALASETTNGNAGYSLTVHANGDVAVGGVFYGVADLNGGTAVNEITSVGEGDAYVAKYDGDGNYQWARRCGGSMRDEITTLTMDEAGNIFYGGDLQGTADIDFSATSVNHTSAGVTDMFIGKLNASGETQWTAAYGGTGLDIVYFMRMGVGDQLTIGGYFSSTVDMDPGPAMANLTSASPDDVNGFVQRFDGNGQLQWAHAFSSTDGCAVYMTQPTTNGGVIVCGAFLGDLDADPGPATTQLDAAGDLDGFVIQLEADGTYRNSYRVGGVQGDEVYAVAQTGQGGIRCAGVFVGTLDLNGPSDPEPLVSAGSQDCFVIDLIEDGVGIHESPIAHLPVIVDPLSRTITVIHEGGSVPYQLHDMNGRILKEGVLSNGRTLLETQILPSGTYSLSTARSSALVLLP